MSNSIAVRSTNWLPFHTSRRFASIRISPKTATAFPEDRDRVVRMLGGGDAAQHGANPREQFVGIEGLDQIVVGPFVQPFDAIAAMAPRRQHDDRHVAMAADLMQQSESVDLGQHDIEDHKIVSLLQSARQPVAAVVRRGHLVAVLREELLHHAA
jgi:hypothetical protein